MPILLVALIAVMFAFVKEGEAPPPTGLQYVIVQIDATTGEVVDVKGYKADYKAQGTVVEVPEGQDVVHGFPRKTPPGKTAHTIDSVMWFTGSPFCITWDKRRICW
jgi:hypothetical protein